MAPLLLRQPLLVALLLAEQAPAACCAANVVAPGAQLQKLVMTLLPSRHRSFPYTPVLIRYARKESKEEGTDRERT